MTAITQPSQTLRSDSGQALQKIVSSVDEVASLPDVTTRIVQATDDPNTSAAKLLKIVSHDPALVAKILKLVNSSFYALPNKIASLERAIAMLGMQSIRNLAIASTLSGMFRGGQLCEGFGPKDLWTHSIAVAVVARELAKKTRLACADEAFLIGMLHDLGLLIIHQKLPKELRKVCETARTEPRNMVDIEHEVLDFDHQELGAALAIRWKFPETVINAIEFHHRPLAAAEQYRGIASLIYVADTVCCGSADGFNLTALHQPIDETILAAVPLTAEVISETQQNIKQLVEMACPFSE